VESLLVTVSFIFFVVQQNGSFSLDYLKFDSKNGKNLYSNVINEMVGVAGNLAFFLNIMGFLEVARKAQSPAHPVMQIQIHI
jgi:hypothetical protein